MRRGGEWDVSGQKRTPEALVLVECHITSLGIGIATMRVESRALIFRQFLLQRR